MEFYTQPTVNFEKQSKTEKGETPLLCGPMRTLELVQPFFTSFEF